MADASRDENNVTTIIGVSNADGTSIVRVVADPTNHSLSIEDGVTGTDLSGDVAARDENFVPVWMAVSSADGVTPVPVYINAANGKLLVDSN